MKINNALEQYSKEKNKNKYLARRWCLFYTRRYKKFNIFIWLN